MSLVTNNSTFANYTQRFLGDALGDAVVYVGPERQNSASENYHEAGLRTACCTV
jgi:hypothetical protein